MTVSLLILYRWQNCSIHNSEGLNDKCQAKHSVRMLFTYEMEHSFLHPVKQQFFKFALEYNIWKVEDIESDWNDWNMLASALCWWY
jgi:hypothetical protein